MQHVVFFGLLAIASICFALVEIQIEGTGGWARDLPTWRYRNRLTDRFLGGRVITGYHLYVHLFVLALVHLPLAVMPDAWSLAIELRIVSFLLLFWVLEDFLWFVFNPAFGLRRFRPEHCSWHAPNWWGLMPRDYWIFLPIGIGAYLLAAA